MKFSNFFKNNWVVTLLSTMIGIIAGLYITDSYESKQLNESKQNAMSMVIQEVTNNQQALKHYDSICRIMYDKSSYVFSYLNSEREIYIHRDSIEQFKMNSGGIIDDLVFENYVNHKDTVRVRGEMNMNIVSKLAVLDLNSVIWDTYKQTNYTSVTSFDCITGLEELYQFQRKNNEVNALWLNTLLDGGFLQNDEELNKFMLLWSKSLKMNSTLLGFYDITEDLFKDCKK